MQPLGAEFGDWGHWGGRTLVRFAELLKVSNRRDTAVFDCRFAGSDL